MNTKYEDLVGPFLDDSWDTKKQVEYAKKFIDDFIKTNGTKAFISERLRDGYIGMEVHTDSGTSYIQATRGRPFGTIVAVPTDDGISYGISYVPDEKKQQYPVIGQFIALAKAVTGKKSNIKSKALKQFEHFELRAKAYFYPEKYSYSRGSEPVDYPNYEKIKKNREKILGTGK